VGHFYSGFLEGTSGSITLKDNHQEMSADKGEVYIIKTTDGKINHFLDDLDAAVKAEASKKKPCGSLTYLKTAYTAIPAETAASFQKMMADLNEKQVALANLINQLDKLPKTQEVTQDFDGISKWASNTAVIVRKYTFPFYYRFWTTGFLGAGSAYCGDDKINVIISDHTHNGESVKDFVEKTPFSDAVISLY
jgi:hypothetical protein